MTLHAAPLNDVLACLCALLCLIASCSVGWHEILMSPDRPNYPTAGWQLRALMFLWSGALMYRAMEFGEGAWTGAAEPVTPGQIFGCFMVAAVHGKLLEGQLRTWLPARTHNYIRRLLDIATCGRADALRRERRRNNDALWPGVERGSENPDGMGPALAVLMMGGFRVIAPNEGPSAALGPDPGADIDRR